MTTDYQSKFWANQLVLQNASDSVESLSRSIANARVELNPHQVDASLFAFRSPLSKGVILADEVGLGKTIEAGIVILQKWAERKRNILLILPATLRTQWQQELADKFFLPSVVLEAKTFNEFKKEGNPNPFNQKNKIVICSYHFASNKAREVAGVKWDLVVIDEAHRLRNVYKTSNKLAKNIRDAVIQYPKMLLTATPLQNTLLELYGLVSFIDSHVFGDQKTFRDQFVNISDDDRRNIQLRERIKPICTRTLRKQVLEYVPYTKRISKLHEFTPTDEEHKLYEEVSAYLQKDVLYALPAAQRQLMTLVVRKLLASSTVAIAQTLRRLISRLEDSLAEIEPELAEDFEGLDEIAEEWSEDDEEADESNAAPVDQSLLKQELEQLRGYLKMAETIQHNTKGDALLKVLKEAFRVVEESKAAHKAVVFTESKRTQKFLYDLLTANGYENKIVILNGENSDDRSKEILKEWKVRHEGTERVTGLRTVDMKAAVVEEFRDRATILIATEAAAEGVNLQFCSLVVNYDLPWNPQRIEQRIGRCHRYGQKHDVVVWNFKNMRNAADQRVYQLLSEKGKGKKPSLASTNIETLESLMDMWFEQNKRGKGCKVLPFDMENESKVYFLVRHGMPFKREGKIEDGETGSVFYRPEFHDVIIYDIEANELQVFNKSGGKKERAMYLSAFGQVFFKDAEYFPNEDKYSLQPLLDDGVDSLICQDIDGLTEVRLTEVQLLFRGPFNDRTILRSKDIFKSLESRKRDFPDYGVLVAASFQVKFDSSSKPRTIKIKTPNIASFDRKEDAHVVEQWMKARGFIKQQEAVADKDDYDAAVEYAPEAAVA